MSLLYWKKVFKMNIKERLMKSFNCNSKVADVAEL